MIPSLQPVVKVVSEKPKKKAKTCSRVTFGVKSEMSNFIAGNFCEVSKLYNPCWYVVVGLQF